MVVPQRGAGAVQIFGREVIAVEVDAGVAVDLEVEVAMRGFAHNCSLYWPI
jgi:hypothetical protein